MALLQRSPELPLLHLAATVAVRGKVAAEAVLAVVIGPRARVGP
jgi:hypothetical protein